MIIVFRRTLAVLLGLVFLLLFTTFVTALHVVRTAGEPAYIKAQLQEVELYSFLYDELIEAAVADAVDRGYPIEGQLFPDGEVRIAFRDPDRAHAAMLDFINTTMPREYVESRVDTFLDQGLPYALGLTDSFEVGLEVDDRVRSLAPAMRKLVEDLALSELLVHELMAPLIRSSSTQLTMGPLGIGFDDEQAAEAAARVFPPEWVEEQVFKVIDTMPSYIAGDTDSFEIQIDLRHGVRGLGEVIKERFDEEGEAVDLLFHRAINPALAEAVGPVTELSYGVTLTEDEVTAAIEQAAPSDWINAEAGRMIDVLVAYITGDTEALYYTVDLRERKEPAIDAIIALAIRKLAETIDALPNCTTPGDVQQAGMDLARSQMPQCSPPGFDSEAASVTFGPRLGAEIRTGLAARMPDEIVYTDERLLGQTGDGSGMSLENIRKTVTEGFRFTDQQLAEQLGRGNPNGAENLQRVRQIVGGGITYSHADLERDLARLPGSNGEDDPVTTVRSTVGTVIQLRWIGYLPLMGLLAGIGFLGGRAWSTRLAWASVTLTVVAFVLFIVVGPLYSHLAGDYFADNLAGERSGTEFRNDWPRTAAVLDSDVWATRVQTLADNWVHGLGILVLTALIIGVVFTVAAGAWIHLTRNKPAGLLQPERSIGA